ncbi:MAG: rod shape-determining protein [Armatimonadetes bacterium]|jgi:rod shape-determining protein MreB|nr:rod shape-determining protein [Armatimonadota bacterium]MDI9603026.1 rod shape-determining protein [Acidobacteriota bacterium]NLN89393.1 rod shape-determining protein [candidate division WS1 bacterium]
MNGWASRLSKGFGLGLNLGIDLGTSNILVWVHGEGLVLNEPSVVAVEKNSGRVLEVGAAAHDMLGKTPGNIVADRPMREGVIADYTLTQRMLSQILRRIAGKRPLFKPQIVLSVPSGVTGVERRAVIQAAGDAGAKRAFPIEEPMAAAIGAGLPIESAGGNMIIDIGGGTTDIAVISLGGAVVSASVRTAGYSMDLAIVRHIRRIHNLMIGERTAEEIKIQIGSAFKLEPELTMSVRGRDMINGLPRTVTVHSAEVREALVEPVGAIVERVKGILEETPPELGGDIIERGIVLTGGGSLLRGLERLLSIETSIPVRVAEDPMLCVVRGTGKALEHIDAMAYSIFEPPPPTLPADL